MRTLVLAAALFATTTLYAQPAQCLGCPTNPCFGPNACGPNCVCVIPAGETRGYCAALLE